MKELKMQDYGLIPLSDTDAIEINGGIWWQIAGAWVIANWDDLKAGWAKGLADHPQP